MQTGSLIRTPVPQSEEHYVGKSKSRLKELQNIIDFIKANVKNLYVNCVQASSWLSIESDNNFQFCAASNRENTDR